MSDVQTTDFSETAASNSAATPNGWPEGQSPSSVNDCARELMAAVKREWNRSHPTVTAGGTANALTLTYGAAPPALVQGLRFSFVAAAANTGAATLNVSGLGATAIKKPGASGLAALTGGEIQAGQVVDVAYDGTEFVMTSPAANLGTVSSVSGGNGLTGSVTSSGSLDVGAGTGITVAADSVSVDKATQADMEAQTASKVVCADNAKWHPGMPKAWVKFHWTGSAISVDASYGVSGVVRNSQGNYTVSFSTAFSSANYGALVSAGSSTVPASTTALVGTQSAGSCVVYGLANSGGNMADPDSYYAAFFGDQ